MARSARAFGNAVIRRLQNPAAPSAAGEARLASRQVCPPWGGFPIRPPGPDHRHSERAERLSNRRAPRLPADRKKNFRESFFALGRNLTIRIQSRDQAGCESFLWNKSQPILFSTSRGPKEKVANPFTGCRI